MKQTLLDTNFILTCIKQKIDFSEEIKLMGIQILIPEQVILEIQNIINSNQKQHFKQDAQLALNLITQNDFEKIKLKKGNVDKAIILFAKENPELIIATLDKEIQNKISNKKIIIREKKRLEII